MFFDFSWFFRFLTKFQNSTDHSECWPSGTQWYRVVLRSLTKLNNISKHFTTLKTTGYHWVPVLQLCTTPITSEIWDGRDSSKIVPSSSWKRFQAHLATFRAPELFVINWYLYFWMQISNHHYEAGLSWKAQHECSCRFFVTDPLLKLPKPEKIIENWFPKLILEPFPSSSEVNFWTFRILCRTYSPFSPIVFLQFYVF